MRIRVAVVLASLLAAAPAALAGLPCPLPPDPVALVPVDARGLRIGVALGSGSSHALAQIGAIKELEARKLRVDLVTGTSAGAIASSPRAT
jgi:hypothetical protein